VKLDEQALRRPDFVPGTPVKLGDGQSWELRRPVVRFVPSANDAGFETRLRLEGDDDYEALCRRADAAARAVREGGEGASTAPYIAAELAMGRAILLGNYDLTPEQVADLLQFSYDPADEAGWELRLSVLAVARGEGPKPSGDGGGSPPSPPA
jgi:hypothetical protein